MTIKGRANTPEEKKQVIDRLYYAWLSVPDLRLGQFLECAKPKNLDDLFYIEDNDLANHIEKFVEENGK